MANANKPWGLKPVKSLISGDYDGRGNVYHIPSTDSTYSYFVGDAVALSGTGDANGIPDVAKFVPGAGEASSGVNGAAPVGVIIAIGTNAQGPWINPSDLTKIWAPQTKAVDYYCLVADDPWLIFEIQDTGTGTALAAVDIGLNCRLAYTAAPSTGYVSSTTLDNANKGTTIGMDVRLLGLAREPGNAFGAYAKWLVMFNGHAFKSTTGT